MKNKKMIVLFLTAIVILFSFSICLANDAKNMTESAVNGTKNMAESATNHVRNFAMDTGNNIDNGVKGVSNYATERTDTTVGGTTQNNWTWIVIGIAAIAIVAIIWYYLVQISNTRTSNNRSDREHSNYDNDHKE